MTRIVIDTNIWVKAMYTNTKDYDFNCEYALHKAAREPEWQLTMDTEGQIKNEYEKNIYKNLADTRRYQEFMLRFDMVGKKCFVSSKLGSKHTKNLVKKGFHEPQDHIFVGTAMNADKVIVTEDSDYGVHGEKDKEAVAQYMQEQMGLKVYSAEGFANIST